MEIHASKAVRAYMRRIGAKGGLAKGGAKAKASAENGRLSTTGGRPCKEHGVVQCKNAVCTRRREKRNKRRAAR